MIKAFSSILLIVLSIMLAGCNPANKSDDNGTSTSNTGSRKHVAKAPANLHTGAMPAGFADVAGGSINIPVGDGVYAFDFEGKSLDGKDVKLADYRGKWVFVDFWATWCGPCVAELPNVVAMSKAIPKLQIIGISLDQPGSGSTVSDFAKQHGMEYPIIVDQDLKDSIAEKYGIQSIPFTILIDPTGAVKYKYLRGDNLTDTVKQAMGA